MKKKLKILSALVVVLLLAIVVLPQIKFQAAPAKSLINTSINIGFGQQYDNQDVEITGPTTEVILDGRHNFNSLIVKDGAKVTHSAVDERGSGIGEELGTGEGKGGKDYFRVIWHGYIELPSGTTGLQVRVDDAVNLCLRKTSDPISSRQCRTGTQLRGGWRLNEGFYEMDLDYYELRGQAYIRLDYCVNGGDCGGDNGRVLPPELFYIKQDKTPGTCGGSDTSTDGHGICAAYYVDYDRYQSRWQGNGTLVMKLVDQNINFNWGGGSFFPFKLGGLQLNIAKDLTLDGGQIDVSGKGYPGGEGSGARDVTAGYGPGGAPGGSYQLYPERRDDISGGGGGFGGKGGKNTNGFYPLEGGQTYEAQLVDPNSPYFLSKTLNQHDSNLNFLLQYKSYDQYSDLVPGIFGSGGAGGNHETWNNNHHSSGGRGGGSIIIQAQKVSANVVGYDLPMILANGDWAGGEYSGAGSGGLIYIKANETNLHIVPNVGSSDGGAEGSKLVTDPSIITSHGSIPINLMIEAKGGCNGECQNPELDSNAIQGGGGGGRVVIDTPVGPASTTTDNTSQMLRVEVSWPEGTRTEMIDLKTLLRDTRY